MTLKELIFMTLLYVRRIFCVNNNYVLRYIHTPLAPYIKWTYYCITQNPLINAAKNNLTNYAQ